MSLSITQIQGLELPLLQSLLITLQLILCSAFAGGSPQYLDGLSQGREAWGVQQHSLLQVM